MSDRIEQRKELELPVRISGLDANGCLFEQDAETMDVTTTGARLSQVRHSLHRGCIISVQRGSSKARFRVMWVGEDRGPDEGQIGIKLVDSGKLIWGQVIPRIFGDNFRREQATCASPLPTQARRAETGCTSNGLAVLHTGYRNK